MIYQCGNDGMIDLSDKALEILQGCIDEYLNGKADTRVDQELHGFATDIRSWLQHRPGKRFVELPQRIDNDDLR